MTQFFIGFFAAWFIIAAFFFVTEETGHEVAHFFSEWTYYILAAPVLLPVLAVAYPVALTKKVCRQLMERLDNKRRAAR